MFGAGLVLFVTAWIGVAALIPGGVFLTVICSSACFLAGAVLGGTGLLPGSRGRTRALLGLLLNAGGLMLASRFFVFSF